MANPFDQFDDHSAPIPIAPGNPSKVMRDRNEAAASALDPARARADLQGQNISNALNELNIRAKAEELRKAEEERKAREEDAKRDASAKSENIYKIERAIGLLDAIQADAADNGGWGETGKSGALARKYLGEGSAAYDLSGKVQGVRGINFIEAIKQLKAASKTGSTGAGGLTETEGKKLEDALAVLDPNLSQGEFLNQIDIARKAYLDSYRRLGGANPKIDPEAANQAPPQDRLTAATGNTRTEIDPLRKAVLSRVGQMVAANPNRKQVERFIRSNDMDPGSFNLDELFRYRASPDFIKWQRANPGKAFAPNPQDYTREVPLTGTAATMNKVSQSAPGAYLASAANAVAGGHLDDLGGESVNTGLMMMQSEHPGASFLGDMTGQGLFEATAGRIPGLRALNGTRFGQAGMDALYGGYAGSGSEGGGILSGALGNAAGGGLARGASRAAGGILNGVQSPSLNYLNQRDVPLTIGQIGRGSNSTVGHAVGGIEERLAGLPIADAIIGTARRRGDQGFNAAAFREMGASGATGAAGVAEGQNMVNRAYDFLNHTTFPADAAFNADRAAIRATLPRNLGAGVADRLDNIDNAIGAGVLTGRDWQSAVRGVRADRSSLRGQPFSDQAINSLDRTETSLMDLAARRGPPDTAANLANANHLNGQFQTITSALDNGPAQRAGELFSASRLSDASRAGARNFGGRTASMQGNRPFYDLTRAGMDVMPNLTPDSGTAGRSLFYAALPGIIGGGGLGLASGGDAQDGAEGAGIGAGATLLPTLALMALYSNRGQRGAQRALLGPRSAHTQQVGQSLLDRRVQRIFGSLGSATARDLLLNPELKK